MAQAGRFDFKQFSVSNVQSAMRVGTDGVLLGAWLMADNPRRILDIGCGTGVIALMMLQRFGSAHVTAIDIDGQSVHEADMNLRQSPWADRGRAVHCDVNEYEADLPYDCIVSNPPFFTEDTRSPDSRRAEARHGVTLTAVSLLSASLPLATDDATLSFIAPCALSEAVMLEAALTGWHPLRMTDVVTREGRPAGRRLWQLTRSRAVAPVKMDVLTLRDSSNRYTAGYRRLVDDFYLHMA